MLSRIRERIAYRRMVRQAPVIGERRLPLGFTRWHALMIGLGLTGGYLEVTADHWWQALAGGGCFALAAWFAWRER